MTKLPNSLSQVLNKSKASQELIIEFTNFLEQHSHWKEQALYLLKEKHKRISEIIHDLYGIPIGDQANWSNKNVVEESSKKIENFVINLQNSEKFGIQKRKLFQDCKEEHGLNNAPLELKNTYTIVRIEPFLDKEMKQSFCWKFLQSKLQTKGWGLEKPLKNLKTDLLNNKYLASWIVKNYLANNPVIKEKNYPHSEEIPSSLILDGEETHYLLCLLFGYPLLYFQGSKQTIIRNNHCVNWQLQYNNIDGYKIIYIIFHSLDTEYPFDFQAHKNKIYFLCGITQAMIIEHNYWQIQNNRLNTSMMQEALKGILVADQEWELFLEKWTSNYDLPLHQAQQNEELTNNFVIKDLKEWSFWLKLDTKSIKPVFKKGVNLPKFYLSTELKKYNKNYVALKIEDFNPQEHYLENSSECLHIAKLFHYLKYILTQKKKNGFYILDKVMIAQFLSLAKDYPYTYNHKNQPLFDHNIKLHFAITIQKDPVVKSQYIFKGMFYEKTISAKQETYIPFLTKTHQTQQILGVIPSYLIYKNKIFSIENMVSGKFMSDYITTILAKKEDIGDFYSNIYPLLKTQNLQFFDPEKLLDAFAIFSYKIQGKMEIVETDKILVGKLSAIMQTEVGDFDYPIYSKHHSFQKTLHEKSFSIPRNKEMEKELFDILGDCGWIYKNIVENDKGIFYMQENNTLNFLMHILPQQTTNEKIKYYINKDLKRWKITNAVTQISANIQTKTNWFELNFDVKNCDIDLKKIITAWQEGSNHIDLGEDKGLIRIDKNWMERYIPILYHLYSSDIKDNKDKNLRNKLLVAKHNLGLLRELENINNEKKSVFRPLKIISQNIPPEVKAKLRTYQKEGVDWLCFLRKHNFGGILADDMGLGKTLQALTFFQIIRKPIEHRQHKPHLVICPTSVIANWEEEVNKFVPSMKIIIYHGTSRKKYNNQLKKTDLIITTYSLLQKDTLFFKKIKYNVILLDEAQNIKNANSKTSKGVCVLEGRQRISLTGTPIENNITELWAQFHFLMPKFLGSYKNFQQIYVKPCRVNANKEYDFSLLRKQIKPFILRRIKQNVAKYLPPKTEQILYCEMTQGQRRLYDKVLVNEKNLLLNKIDNKIFANQIKISVFAALLKLRQICCDPRLSNTLKINPPPSSKLELFLNHVEAIVSEGHRILVFSQFVKMLKLMHSPLQKRDIHFLQLDGSTKNRHQVIKKFQQDGNYPVFLISLKAGGVGLNLTAADYVIHYDPWWNPAVVAQASDRVYRIGQNKHVFIYKLITKDSIEEKILTLQDKKQSLFNNVINAFNNSSNISQTGWIEKLFS